MKTRVLLFTTFLAGVVSLHAQNGNVGIGTTTPSSKLTVNGNAAVGSGYTGTAAPVDGAIIQGKVGIGTATPGTNLQVIGGIAGGTAFGVTGTALVDNIYLELSGNTTLPAPNANGQMLFVKNNTTGNVTLSKGYTGGLFDAFSQTDVASMNIVPIGHKVFIGYIVGGNTGWIAQLSQDPSMQPVNFWNLAGNTGTSPSTNFVGTTDNQDLVFRANNLEAMRVIASTGSVAIGTATPLGKLHVEGGDVDITMGTNSQWELLPSIGGSTGSTGSFEIIDRVNHTRRLVMNNNGNIYMGGGLVNNMGSNAGLTVLGSGNVGINNVTPTYPLDVNGNVRSLSLFASNSVGIGTTTPAYNLDVTGSSRTTNLFATNAIGIGTVSPVYPLDMNIGSSHAVGMQMISTAANMGGGGLIQLRKSGAATPGEVWTNYVANGASIGSVTSSTASSVAYNTTSDVRLKENIKNTSMGIHDVMKIHVKDYNYKADKEKTPQTGFIAQQLHTVFPMAVTKGGEDVTKSPWAVDYGKVTPLLTKAIQDQQKTIEALEGRIKALEAQNKQLAAVSANCTATQQAYAELAAQVKEMQQMLGVSKINTGAKVASR